MTYRIPLVLVILISIIILLTTLSWVHITLHSTRPWFHGHHGGHLIRLKSCNQIHNSTLAGSYVSLLWLLVITSGAYSSTSYYSQTGKPWHTVTAMNKWQAEWMSMGHCWFWLLLSVYVVSHLNIKWPSTHDNACFWARNAHFLQEVLHMFFDFDLLAQLLCNMPCIARQ